MLKRKEYYADFLNDWSPQRLLELASIPAPSPPTFPSFTELVRLDAEGQALERAPQSLFESLLGRPDALYADSVEHPEKYSAETLELLTHLAGGTKKLDGLSREEKRLLDLGTIDFASTPGRKRPRPTGPTPQRGPTGRAEPTPGVDVPDDAVAPYWWLR